jgi:transposase InsO family protein
MARKVTSMKVIAAVTAFVAGEPVNVARTCREAGVSRKTFYKWAARYRVDGLAGFEERSRRPRVTPSRTPDDVESLIVALRARLLEAGLDHGARSVQWHLGREPAMRGRRVPAAATVHRVLVRHGVVEPQPRKRPTSSWRRFEAPAPNEWWQIDAMDWVIATGPVSVFNIIDDHSRVAARSRAVTHATTAEAWTTFCQAAQQWGLPAGVLSDNGLCFSGKLRQFEVAFEANLRDAGVRPITGRPFHPQTTGKVERFQQTLKKWLRKRGLHPSIAELQADLDEFNRIYNTERPHQGIGRQIPIERWRATPVAGPAEQALDHPDWTSKNLQVLVQANGCVNADRFVIHVGVEHHGRLALVVIDRTRANVFIHGSLIRHLKLDHTRSYQPSGRKRGGPHKQRLRS